MEELIYLLVKLLVKGMSNSGSSRQQEQAKQARLAWEQRQAWEQMRRLQAGPPPAPPPLPAKRGKRRGKGSAGPPAVPTSSVGSFLTGSTPEPAGSGPAAPAVMAPSIAGLREPRTLREQFVLSEILRAPVALRPPI